MADEEFVTLSIMRTSLLSFCFVCCFSLPCLARDLSLPDPLLIKDGSRVKNSSQWQQQRRSEVLELFRENVYGRRPVQRPEGLKFTLLSKDEEAMGGKAVHRQVEISFSGGKEGERKGKISVTIFHPRGTSKAVPGYLLICHRGHENIDPSRKVKMPFWPAERIVERGYAANAIHVSDVDPDKHDGFKNGVHGIFDGEKRLPDAWGTISAWGWGASRIMDYLETDKAIDVRKIAVVGHSRGGKAALWCDAEDERFAMAVSNNSGCTGAALARNKKGESIKVINKRFPHWFCENYHTARQKIVV